MSKAIRWQVPFKTLSGQNAVVSIYEEDYAGDVVTLQAGATPFVTQEDDDEDMLSPVRTQSGYLRVINDGNLDGLMPTNDMEHQVILTVGGTLRWIGYMQSGQYGRQMYVPNEEVSFALIDPLAALGGVQMDSSIEMGMTWLGALLYEAIAAMRLSSLLEVVWPTEWTDTDNNAAGWLKLEVSRYNFFVVNDGENQDDADYTKYDSITYKTLLENICSLMGWTATMKGAELRLVSPYASGYVSVAEQDLYDAMNEGVLPTVTSATIQDTIWAVTTDDSGGSDNQQETLLGYKGVKIAADVNAVDDVEGIEVSTTGLEYVRVLSVGTTITGYSVRALCYESGQRTEGSTGTMTLHHYRGEYGTQMEWTEATYNPRIDTYETDGYLTTQLVRYDKYQSEEATNGTKISYEYADGILVRQSIPTNTGVLVDDAFLPIVTFSGTALPVVSDGCIDLHAEYDNISTLTIADVYPLLMKLQVGKHYWNGTEWTETESTFSVNVKDAALKVTKTLQMDYEGASGHVIPITSAMSGKVTLTIYNNAELLGASGTYILKGVSLSYCPPSSEVVNITKSTNYYYATVSNGYKERKSISLSMATKTSRCKSGLGILAYNGAVFALGDLQYDGVSAIPEKVLLSKAKEIYCRPTELIRPTLKLGAGAVPGVGEICTHGSEQYEVLGRTVDWRMERVTLMCEALA